MSSIATCPDCAAQIALPEFAAGDDRALCPQCRAEFTVGDVERCSVPVAHLMPPEEETATETKREQPAPLDESSPAFHSAETVALSSTTLAGWEERLKRAIESTATDSDDPSPPSSQRTLVLEEAPEFDFHLDPPEESPADSCSAPAVNLPDSHEWFDGNHVPLPSEPQSEFTAEPAPVAPIRRHRGRGAALMKHSVAALICGAVGVLLGQYFLLWLRGPSADYIQLAHVLPDMMRPTVNAPRDFVRPIVIRPPVAPSPEPNETSPVEKIARQLAESEPQESDPAPPVAPPLMQDDAVEPALASLAVPPLLPLTNTTPAEFAELAEAARSAVPALLSGDLKSQESARVKGHAYMAFCRLAERFDFASDLTLGPEAEREAARACALFRTTAASAAPQPDFAFIVTRWWQHAERPTQGIFLTGRVESVEPVGDRTLYRVEVALPNETTLIPVLAERANFQQGDQIAVVGTIVANPRNALRDFPLNLPQLAVAQDSFAVALD